MSLIRKDRHTTAERPLHAFFSSRKRPARVASLTVEETTKQQFARTEAAAAVAHRSSLSSSSSIFRLHTIEIQCIMRYLDIPNIVRLSRASKQMMIIAQHSFVWHDIVIATADKVPDRFAQYVTKMIVNNYSEFASPLFDSLRRFRNIKTLIVKFAYHHHNDQRGQLSFGAMLSNQQFELIRHLDIYASWYQYDRRDSKLMAQLKQLKNMQSLTVRAEQTCWIDELIFDCEFDSIREYADRQWCSPNFTHSLASAMPNSVTSFTWVISLADVCRYPPRLIEAMASSSTSLMYTITNRCAHIKQIRMLIVNCSNENNASSFVELMMKMINDDFDVTIITHLDSDVASQRTHTTIIA